MDQATEGRIQMALPRSFRSVCVLYHTLFMHRLMREQAYKRKSYTSARDDRLAFTPQSS